MNKVIENITEAQLPVNVMPIASRIKTYLRHNQTLVAGAIVCVLLLAWSGCDVMTESPFTDEPVTRAELDAEVQMYVVKVSSAVEDLDKQEAMRKALLEAGWAIAQGGAVDPVGLGFTLAGILGLGAVIDNRKKDSIIKSKSNALVTLGSSNG